MRIDVYILLVISIQIYNVGAGILEDFCAHEYFQPKCSANEIIVMEKAIYGRMKLGRCLVMDPSDPGINNSRFIGCYSDVIDIMDRKCSGLKSCNVLVIDPELIKRSKCYPGLMLYLEAAYSCYPIASPDRSCSLAVGNEPLHISVIDVFDSPINRCFSRGSSLNLEASHGQTINVSIIEFVQQVTDMKNKADLNDGNSDPVCNRRSRSNNIKSHPSELLGTLRSNIGNAETQQEYICSGGQRRRNVFSSNSNKAELQLASNAKTRFLLSFIATGCHDMKPPHDGWMKRERNEMIVGCHMNRHTWKLVCNGRNWVGAIGNCSQLNEPFDLDISIGNSKIEVYTSKAEHAFFLLLLISLTILIFITTFCVVFICFQRRRYLKISKDTYIENGNLLHKNANGNLFLYNSPNEEIQSKMSLPKSNGTLEKPLDSCYYVLEDQTLEINNLS